MIVKKMPILQGFPDFFTVKKLSNMESEISEFSPIFYDIETTGLSRSSTFCYLIGAVVFDSGNWFLHQWLAENREEEPSLLRAFAEFLHQYNCTVHYNGESFDQPYLEARYQIHRQPSPFSKMASLDLYRKLKPCKGLLKLSSMKQPDLEAFLGTRARNYADGGKCIGLYKKYLADRREDLLECILGHNQEDLNGLGAILSMLGYLCLYKGIYTIDAAEADDGQILFSLTLPFPLPVPVSNGKNGFYIKAFSCTARILISLHEGKLKRYYENYKDYDYIPSEDTAIPKALSAYMAKNLRRPAKPETCYTWFACSGRFLNDKAMQENYLHHTLPFLLHSLDK